MDTGEWRSRRRDAVAAQADALERQRQRDVVKARELIDDFVEQARERGIEPVTLRARVPGRRTTYRTGLVGWYVRANRSLAVSTDGAFYILDVPARLRSRVSGADVRPSEPPVTVGRGARDGESIGLADLLQKRLADLA